MIADISPSLLSSLYNSNNVEREKNLKGLTELFMCLNNTTKKKSLSLSAIYTELLFLSRSNLSSWTEYTMPLWTSGLLTL